MNVDLHTFTPREWAIWDAAHLNGYLGGHEAGWKAADDQAARVHREAVRNVRAVADIPPRDRSADRRRRDEIEARWVR